MFTDPASVNLTIMINHARRSYDAGNRLGKSTQVCAISSSAPAHEKGGGVISIHPMENMVESVAVGASSRAASFKSEEQTLVNSYEELMEMIQVKMYLFIIKCV